MLSEELEKALRSKKELLSFTKKALKKYSIRPRKKLGQSFSISPAYLETFRAEVSRWALSGPAVEVGTGLGTLTYYVASRISGLEVVGIECDPKLFEASLEVAGVLESVSLVLADALRFLGTMSYSTVFSSAPYSISTPMLAALARNNSVKLAVLGLQKEVAERVRATPGTESYGRLTVLISLHFDVEVVGEFGQSDFFPRPEVRTAVVTLRRREAYDALLGPLLERFTACAFSARNKKARKEVFRCLTELGVREDRARSLAEGLVCEEARVRDLSPSAVREIVARALANAA